MTVLAVLGAWVALRTAGLPSADSEVGPDRIAEALVVQRGLESESKLHTVRWFPHTALPESSGSHQLSSTTPACIECSNTLTLTDSS